MGFKTVIRSARRRFKMSQEELAKEAGVSLPLIVAIEGGERRTSRAVFLKVSKVLEKKGMNFLKMFNAWEG